MTLSPTYCSKKGNCINLIEELLRRTKTSALSEPPIFLRISTSYIAYPAVFLELIICAPKKMSEEG